MDLRQFFDGFFRLNEELGSFFEESLLNKDVFFGNIHDHNQQQQNLSPREMMLKPRSERPAARPSFGDTIIDQGDNRLFRSQTFEKIINTDHNGQMEEKIVIRDSDGTEKIITKHSANGRTTQKEVLRKGNQIISEKEIVSDIGDDLSQIGFHNQNGNNFSNNYNSNSKSQEGGSWRFWSWFK